MTGRGTLDFIVFKDFFIVWADKAACGFYGLLSLKKREKNHRNSNCMHLSQHTHPSCPKKNGVGEWELDRTTHPYINSDG